VIIIGRRMLTSTSTAPVSSCQTEFDFIVN
jgi:hypothetical protein